MRRIAIQAAIQPRRVRRRRQQQLGDARSSGVVTLRFSLGAGTTTITLPPARSTARRRRWPREHLARERRARARAPRGGRPAASAPPTARCARASRSPRPSPSTALDRVGDRRGGDRRSRRSSSARAPRAPPLDELGVTSGRAASWTSTGSPSAGRGERQAHRLRAHCRRRRTAVTPGGAGAARAAARRRSCSIACDAARSASMLHCSSGRPASSTSAFGPAGAETLAAAGGHDQRDRHRSGAVAHAAARPAAIAAACAKPRYLARPPPSGCRPSRRAARRGSSRPRPRPCRARTSARRRGSSWCA